MAGFRVRVNGGEQTVSNTTGVGVKITNLSATGNIMELWGGATPTLQFYIQTDGAAVFTGTITFANISSAVVTGTTAVIGGTSAAQPTGVSGYFVNTSSSDPRGLMTAQYSTDTTAARLHFRKGRGTEAGPTVVVTGDMLGRMRFSGYDGSSYLQMASVDAQVTGTVGANRVPTKLTFATATDAATSVLTTALTLNEKQQALFTDGSAGAPSVAVASAPTTGMYLYDSNGMAFSRAGTARLYIGGGLRMSSDVDLSWTNSTSNPNTTTDVTLVRDAANTLALRNGTNAQAFLPYGYLSGSRKGYGSVQTAVGSVTLSGASTATGNIIPAGAFVVGVATTTTTAITGASGYTVGDGSDVDRYGDITGTALGTHSDNTSATANPTGYNAAASAITLTAKTSNFTGGVVQVVVFYLTTGAA